MLKRNPDAASAFDGSLTSEAPLPFLNLADLLATLRRQWPLIVGCTILMILLGAGYLMTAAPRFTATVSIMIDTRKNQLFQSQQVVGDIQVDSSAVDSQVEILKSESVALAVIRELKLTDDSEFNGSGGQGLLRTVLGSLRGLVQFGEGKTAAASEYQIERTAVGIFGGNLNVKRVGLSYAIDISFTSLNAAKAAQIANAIADSYMVGELEAKYQATKRASKWLQDRIAELRTQASAADGAVQQFKTENNIIDTGRGLMSDQQLSDVNAQLVTAKAGTAEAKARLDRITEIAGGDVPDATVADALRNDVITRLRAQYLDLSNREADWSARYGSSHIATINLRNQMREIKKSIADELRRIAQTYKSDYEIARAREQSLESSLQALVGQAALTGQAQIKLRDLESSSQTYRNLYDNFLQRFMETTQQQTFPISESRVITAATEPLTKSAPRSTLALAGCAVAGLLLGVAAALTRERLDNMFRTVSQVEEVAGMECLGVLPAITTIPAASNAVPANREAHILRTSLGIHRYVVDAPFARFTETLRSAKVAADIKAFSQETRVIGIVSALPNEGKTTVASNLAQLVAHTGHRALLIDADLRNPSMTKALAPEAKEGLVDILAGRRTEADVRWTDPITGLHVIPAVIEGRISHTAELISSPAMANLLSRSRENYDYIFVDLPPIAPVVDVRAAAHLIDGFLFVIEWGRTTKDIIGEVVTTHDLVRSRAIGAVLNKANPAMLRRLENYKGRHYRSYYREYGYSQES